MSRIEEKTTTILEDAVTPATETLHRAEHAVETIEEENASEIDTNVEEMSVSEKELETEKKMENNYREMSPFTLITRRFFRSKLSIVGLIMVVGLFLFSFIGPVIYTRWYDPDAKGNEFVVDRSSVTKYTYVTNTYVDENGDVIEYVEAIEKVIEGNTYASPSKDHFLGTDDQGYDVFTRLMYGGRISLTIGFIVVILETIIGVVLGGLAGYFGGWVDQLIMRIVDIFNCIPTLPILLIASAVIDGWKVAGSITDDQQIYVLMVMITLFSWSGTARLVRGQILGLREQEYITATEVMGLPTGRRIFMHLIPNVMPQLIVSMTLGLGSVILYESTLSYLGLGVPIGKAAWGTMIALSNDPVALQYHVNTWLPAGFMIVIAVLGFNFVGDGLRDAMDPKAKK